jgi:prolyl oligopeptidase
LDWAKHRSKLTTDKFDGLPRTQTLLEEMQSLASTKGPTPNFWVFGEDLFRLRKDQSHKQGILERCKRNASTSPDESEWQRVVDIDQLGAKENRIFEFHSYVECCLLGPDAERLLLLLSDGGADLVELREIDAVTGEMIPSGFRTPLGRITVTWFDRDHLLICHAIYGGPKTTGDWPATSYIWERGTELKDAKPVFTSPTTDSIAVVSSLGAPGSGRALITRAVDYSTFIYVVVSVDGTVEELSAIPKAQSMTIPAKVTTGHLLVSLAEETVVCGKPVPVGSLIAYDLHSDASPLDRLSIVYEPEKDEVNSNLWGNGLRATRTRFHCAMNKRGIEKRMAFEYLDGEWKLVRSVPTSTGSRVSIDSVDYYSNDIIVCESGLLCPSTFWLEDADGAQQLLYMQKPAFDASAFILRQQTAESKDGTSVDYLLLTPKAPQADKGKLPVLMTGYGAYGICFPTSYLDQMIGGLSLVPWINRGGSLVIPFIRGGGERGEQWHEAARQKKRQNSYDDFFAVTEALVRDGFSTPEHIGLFGMSNGGLLAAVMYTQRPDLFGAVVSDVPLIDMLRYTKMGMGGAWIYEYGDPSEPKMAEVLKSYSPFHNIHEAVSYPPCLVTISTNDDRVGAGHGRKFAAKLEDAGASNLYFFEDDSGGHNVSDSFKNAELLARRLSFFMEYLM